MPLSNKHRAVVWLTMALIAVALAYAMLPRTSHKVSESALVQAEIAKPKARRSDFPRLQSESAISGWLASLPLHGLPSISKSHRPSAIESTLEGYGEWLEATYPRFDTKFLGVDCDAAPCLIGLSFSESDITKVFEIRSFYLGCQQELERRLGWKLDYINADEDKSGRQYLWAYSLPPGLDNDRRQELITSADDRHTARMDPIRAAVAPPIPGLGEPGFMILNNSGK